MLEIFFNSESIFKNFFTIALSGALFGSIKSNGVNIPFSDPV